MKKNLTILLMGLLSYGIGISCANAKQYSLWQVYQAASLNERKYNQAGLEVKANQANYRQHRAALLPQIKLNAQQDWLNKKYLLNNPQNNQQTKINLTIEQSLVDPAKWVNKQQADKLLQQSQYQQQQAQNSLILQIAKDYFELQRNYEQLDNIDLEIASAEQRLNLVTSQFEQAQSNSADINEVLARLQIIKVRRLQAEQKIHDKQLDLASISALDEIEPRQLPQQHQQLDFFSQLSTADLQQQAQQQAPDLLNSKAGLDASVLNVRRSKTNLLPKLSLTLTQSKQHGFSSTNNPSASGWQNNQKVGLTLSVPIFSSGKNYAKIEQQIAHLEQSQVAYEQQQRTTSNQIKQACSEIELQRNKIELLNKAIDSHKQLLKSMQLAYQEGLRNNIDVLDAQQELHKVQLNLLHARQDYWLAELKLKARVQGLVDDDIRQLDQIMQNQ